MIDDLPMGCTRVVDITGKRFGMLLVKQVAGRSKSGEAMWECACDCGATAIVRGSKLRSREIHSCGCAWNAPKHGHATRSNGKSSEYIAWQHIISRCSNPKVKSYPNYGGRGISVCEKWKNSFEAFYEDVGPKPTPSHSIDRIDVNGNYEPGNVRWATWQVQNSNRRNTTYVEIDGEKVSLVALAIKSGLRLRTIRMRFKLGWKPEYLCQPLSHKGYKKGVYL